MNKNIDYNLEMFNIFSALLNIINNGKIENSINKTIANYLLINLNKLKNMTIYDVAADCYVSRSSIHRFLKEIGINKFSQLNDIFTNSKPHYESFIISNNTNNYTNDLKIEIDNIINQLHNYITELKIPEFVNLILKHQKIHILIAETSINSAKLFQEELLAINKLINVYTSYNISKDYINHLNSDDLLICCSTTGNYGFAILKDLKNCPAQKILLTLNRSQILNSHFDQVYYISNQKICHDSYITSQRNSYSKYSLLFYFELVYKLILEQTKK